MIKQIDEKLDRSFFDQNCCLVAEKLLGQILVLGNYRGIITETESYRGSDDPASHAFKGLTPRTKLMFGPSGFSYVYLIYGMYHCFNIVTEGEGNPSAVLIRGLKLLTPENKILNGPGKLCKYLEINKNHNNIDIVSAENFYIAKTSPIKEFNITPRIGIKTATDKLWRFVAHY